MNQKGILHLNKLNQVFQAIFELNPIADVPFVTSWPIEFKLHNKFDKNIGNFVKEIEILEINYRPIEKINAEVLISVDVDNNKPVYRFTLDGAVFSITNIE